MNNKILIPIIIILVLGIGVFAWHYFIRPVEEPVVDFLTYENLTYGISIKYPQNWRKDEQQPSKPLVVRFISPGRLFGRLLETVNITIVNLSASPMTLSEWIELYSSYLPQVFPDLNVIESGYTLLAGYPAYKRVFTHTDTEHQVKVKSLSVKTVKDNKVYMIAYNAKVENYFKFLGIAEKMIDSFKIF